MSNLSMSSLARALPSVWRPCRFPRSPLPSPVRLTRPFSSSPMVFSSEKEKSEIEKQMLDTKPEQAPEDNSPLSAITRMMQGEKTRTSQTVSRDYSRMAESLEAELIKQPYSDHTPPYHLHVYSHKHNTIMTLTRPNGSPLLSMSCGHLGFRKGHRAGYDPAYQLAVHVFGQIQERGYLIDMRSLELIFRGFGPGRDAIINVLLRNEGRNIRGLVTRVSDSTRIKFGGTRSRKVRRL